MNRVMKIFRRIIASVMAVALAVAVSACVSGQGAQGWRQKRSEATDTFYPGIKFGMTRAQVKEKIPPGYRIIEDKPEKLSVEKVEPSGRVDHIDFDFEEGLLISTSDRG